MSVVHFGEPNGGWCVFPAAMHAFTVQGTNGAVVFCIVPLVSTFSDIQPGAIFRAGGGRGNDV